MSTRCITEVFDEQGRSVACIYRHCGGYPSGQGELIANFLSRVQMVNGLDGKPADPGKYKVNGHGRLAADLIVTMETLGVSPRLLPTGTRDIIWKEYVYEVRFPLMRVSDRDSTLYEGDWSGFGAWLAASEQEEEEEP